MAQGEKYLLCKAHLGFHSPKPWEESFYLWPKRRVSLILPNYHPVEYKKAKVFLIFYFSSISTGGGERARRKETLREV